MNRDFVFFRGKKDDFRGIERVFLRELELRDERARRKKRGIGKNAVSLAGILTIYPPIYEK